MVTPENIWPQLPIEQIISEPALLALIDVLQGQIAAVERRLADARDVMIALAIFPHDEGAQSYQRVIGELLAQCDIILTRLRTDRDRVNARLAEIHR